MSINEYNDMSVFDAINKIKDDEIILPDIQREYCWQTKDIEELFFSIVNNFPIGAFIIWKTNGSNLRNSSSEFYKFLDEAKYKKKREEMISKNSSLRKNFRNDDYFVVLDGQQRLTSFNLVFRGSIYIKKTGNTGSDDKNANFDEKELYYDLNHFNEDPDGETNPFIFLKEEEVSDGNYYEIKSMYRYLNNETEFYADLKKITNGYDDRVASNLSNLYKRLNQNGRDQSLIHYYTINSDKYDDALNVFVKVNSSGKALNKTDLLFSTLINGWEKDKKKKEGKRKEIENYIDGINDKYGFDIDKDFLLRTIYVLANDGKSVLSMQEICKPEIINKIRKTWKKATRSIDKALKSLKEIDINDARVLSYNAIIPIVYYVHLGGKFNTDVLRQELKKYFAIAFAKGLFGGSSNQAIENTCKDIKKHIKEEEFNIEYFKNTDFSGGRTFTVDIDTINNWLNKYEKGKKTYSLLMLVSPYLNLLKENYDQDHSHADTLFTEEKMKKHKIDVSKGDLWRSKRNLLPNLSFMIRSDNRSKNKDDLDTWMKKNEDKICTLRCLPVDIDYSFSNFEQFFKLRRSMIKYVLVKTFNIKGEEIEKDNYVTINEEVIGDSSIKIGMHGKVKEIIDGVAKVELYDREGNSKGVFSIETDKLYLVEDF